MKLPAGRTLSDHGKYWDGVWWMLYSLATDASIPHYRRMEFFDAVALARRIEALPLQEKS